MRLENIERLPVEYRELIEEYCSAIGEHFKDRLVSLCVFGSVAKGEATPESDIDVVVVAEGLPQDIGSRIRETVDLHLRLGEGKGAKRLKGLGRSASISEVIFTPTEADRHPPILLDVVDEGVILYDKGRFLEGALNSIRERMREFGSKKVRTRKGHFWILKPDIKPGEEVRI